jgi:hypothetical protein
VNKGTTIKFKPTSVNGDNKTTGVEWVINITDLLKPVEYYIDVLKAVGYRHVDKRADQLETWVTPGGSRATTVFFLFDTGADLPVATSPDGDALDRLKNALEFIESGRSEYKVGERELPTTG